MFSHATLEIASRVLQSPGRPMDRIVRHDMEQAFGRDLSHVRIHDDEEAHVSTSLLNARAWAAGHHIAFAKGCYRPEDVSGRRLLAHELVHVLQQHGSPLDPGTAPPIAYIPDVFERRAEEISELPLWEHPEGQAHSGTVPAIAPIGKCFLYRAISEQCAAPGAALGSILSPGPLGLANGMFGEVAERLIELDYITIRPGRVLVNHFFDNAVTSSYIAFLAFHNAHIRNPITLAQLAVLANMPGGGIARPDILTHQGLVQEYYEIKPDSPAGRTEGRLKMSAVDAFMGTFGLPYPRGTTFTPSPTIALGSGTIPTVKGLVPFKVFLRVRRSGAGLLVYRVCVETDFAAIGLTALAVIGIIILALLLARFPIGVPFPPGLPPPVVV